MKRLEVGDFAMLALVAVAVLGFVVISFDQNGIDTGEPEFASDAAQGTDYSNDYRATREAIPTTDASGDQSLTGEEREARVSDADSYGWSQSDREFLEENGVSESEARAMETILRENGVN